MKRRATVHQLRNIGDDWRRWIGENLILGTPPEALAGILQQNGISSSEAQYEIEAALRSPYLQGSQRLRNRLAKRDWVIGIQAQLNRLAPVHIPRREKLPREDFLQQHYALNRPVIITGMLDDCAARSKWTLDFFASQFGERSVEVQFGRNADQDYEMNSIAHKRQIPFGEFVELVRSSGHTNDFYMTANNDSRNRHALRELWADVPALPEYLKPAGEQQGFFWFGPAGTITPFHHDLTNNFMVQIMGRKRVRLIAPCDTPRLYNQRHCFTPVDGRAIDVQRYPDMAGVPVLDCVLEPGEILFLPVGWWHFVEGLEISVTIAATHFLWDNDFYSNYPPNHDF
ncbi:cupin-like domain-containing protein [Massilia sp. YIM B04103]|uniref:cupin-like domain-containing protein n=1 Tax=Massilia sp. YIM B04103 TaxID=2963106 RepID=UPI00210C2F37|nr:cupin-like domain-containing protein [Massilia sp. YIM B04103]